MSAAAAVLFFRLAAATCDGNPHNWDRVRRCDAYNDACPDAAWAGNCGVCEGIGGIPTSDDNGAIKVPKCEVVHTAAEVAERGLAAPVKPRFEKRFINTGFYEVQIFVKHDPLCIAQIPSIVSNGTHCYKPQEGTFNYDEPSGRLRIDYFKSETPLPGMNMTEYFYHEGTCVHPHITHYGILPSSIACPCINVTVGIVSSDWAADAAYVGRAKLDVEYLGLSGQLVDHWIKGPHHAFVDVASGNIIRLWQPFNGLEVFDPTKWVKNPAVTADWNKTFELPLPCKVEAGRLCIQAHF